MARPSLHEALPSLGHIFRRLWPYIRKERALIVTSMLALLAGVVLRLAEPWPLKLVFDRVLQSSVAGSGKLADVDALRALDPLTLLAVAAGAVLVISSLRAVADYLCRAHLAFISIRVLTDVRNVLYDHLQRLSLSFHARSRSGDLIIRVMGDVGMLRDVTSTALLPMVANVLILVGMWALMFWLQWRLALAATATLPLFWVIAAFSSRRIRDAARKHRQREGAIAATAAESIGAIKVVQALSLEPVFSDAFRGTSKKGLREDIKSSRLSARLERTVDVLLAAATAIVLWYGARLVLAGAMSPGDLLVFLTYLKRAFNPMQDFAKYTGRLSKAAAAGERVLHLLDQEPEVRDRPGAAPAPALRGLVRFEDVTVAYEPGHPVLERVDLRVDAGELVALVGPSGIGKSTLLGLLPRFYDPVAGRVTIDGHDVRDFTLESLRRQVSLVLQDSVLFAVSVRENIAYGAPGGATPEEVEAAARLANAHAFIAALPQGYDTVLGERGGTLSGGQRQRIAIARAAVRRAPVLILDEPTTGLDEENEAAVVDALQRLAAGRTTFLVTHDLRFAARADRVVYLENGRVRESGPHAELMQLGGRYATVYRLQTAATAGPPGDLAEALTPRRPGGIPGREADTDGDPHALAS